MKKVNLSWLLPIFLILGSFIIFLGLSHKAESATAGHIVISEVQIAGASPSADFIELYNPTSSDVNLSTFRLVKRTSSGSTDTNIVDFNSSDVIKSHSFLLWCFNHISSNLGCDKDSGDTLANNNSIALRDGAVNTGAIIDAVTIGVTLHTLGEGASPATPSAGQSIERKANFLSDSAKMGSGGIDELAGNGEDTDNNSVDFVVRDIPQPQNSSSSIEPVPTPTPTDTPTPTPTDIPAVTPTVSPTDIPTPTPTEIPIPTPTVAPTVTPTPTLEPTSTPVPAMTPSPTLSPAPTATITPVPTGIPFPRFTVVCSTKILSFNFGFIHIRIPFLTCRLVRV